MVVCKTDCNFATLFQANYTSNVTTFLKATIPSMPKDAGALCAAVMSQFINITANLGPNSNIPLDTINSLLRKLNDCRRINYFHYYLSLRSLIFSLRFASLVDTHCFSNGTGFASRFGFTYSKPGFKSRSKIGSSTRRKLVPECYFCNCGCSLLLRSYGYLENGRSSRNRQSFV